MVQCGVGVTKVKFVDGREVVVVVVRWIDYVDNGYGVGWDDRQFGPFKVVIVG